VPMPDTKEIDLYDLLDISSAAENETIRRVVSLLEGRYAPDTPVTGDAERFRLVKSAGEILTDPQRRAEYDAARTKRRAEAMEKFWRRRYATGLEGERERRLGILTLLYSHRRLNPERPSVSLLQLETWMTIPREHLMFAVWYLRSRGLIAEMESNNLAITSEGVDHLEACLPGERALYEFVWPLEKVRNNCGSESTSTETTIGT